MQNQLPPNAKNNLSVSPLIAQNAARQWQDFLHGLWQYQHHPLQRTTQADWHVVASLDAVALKCLAPQKNSKTNYKPILLVPSLINRFHILDLQPEHSFARFLRQQGYDVYLVDWHHDTAQPLPDSLEACVQDYLLPLQAHIAQPQHVIGYCMGGTLSLAAAIVKPQQVQSLTLMATPWDFHQPNAQAALQFSHLLHGFGNSTTNGHIASEWLQMLFWQRDPLVALHKFQNFTRRIQDGQDVTNFVLAEDWLNSGVDLPTAFLHDCAQTWFTANAPYRNQWHIGQQPIKLQSMRNVPIHLVNAQRDRLVPPASSTVIQAVIPHATISLFETGHIGLFAGAKSKSHIWPQVQQFLAGHNP